MTPKTATYSSARTFISTLASTNVLVPVGGNSSLVSTRLFRSFWAALALPPFWEYPTFPLTWAKQRVGKVKKLATVTIKHLLISRSSRGDD